MLPFAALRAAAARIAMLGNAAGTVARAYGHFFPRTAVDAVEIDGELFDIGRRYFDLDNPRMEEFAEDARPWLERSDGGYDAIMVDAYRQPYIPFYLATEEFFELARDRLAPGGVVIVNAGHPEGNDDLETCSGGRWRRPSRPSSATRSRTPTRCWSRARRRSPAARLRPAIATLPTELRRRAATAAAALEPRLPGGEVYTDDRAPVEWLIDASFLGYANENWSADRPASRLARHRPAGARPRLRRSTSCAALWRGLTRRGQ